MTRDGAAQPPADEGRSAVALRSTTAPDDWAALTVRMVWSALQTVLPWWVGSRVVALLGLAVSRSGWDSPGDSYIGTQGEVGSYHVWDVGFFLTIADRGYGATWSKGTPAFMPLMPAVMHYGGDLIGGHPLVAGAIAANLGTLIAGTSLYLLVRMGIVPARPGSHWAGVYSVAFLLLSPFGLPLFNAYTETLLLAAALPAWIAARREVWWLAGPLASVAVLARVTGLSVAFGIGVMWLISQWSSRARVRGRPWWLSWAARARQLAVPSVVWVLLPLATYAGWLAYLHAITGQWDAITSAQDRIWNRQVVFPWVGLARSIEQLGSPFYGHVMIREVAATLFVGVIVGLLIWRRMWPETAFAASTWLVLTSNSLWIGGSLRAITTMFPFWMLVGFGAAALARRRNGHSWITVSLMLCGLGLFWSELLLSQLAFIF